MKSENLVAEFKRQANEFLKKQGNNQADAIKYERQSQYLRKLRR